MIQTFGDQPIRVLESKPLKCQAINNVTFDLKSHTRFKYNKFSVLLGYFILHLKAIIFFWVNTSIREIFLKTCYWQYLFHPRFTLIVFSKVCSKLKLKEKKSCVTYQTDRCYIFLFLPIMPLYLKLKNLGVVFSQKKDVYNNCNSIFMVSNVSVTFIFFILFYAGSWNTKLLIFLHPDIS